MWLLAKRLDWTLPAWLFGKAVGSYKGDHFIDRDVVGINRRNPMNPSAMWKVRLLAFFFFFFFLFYLLILW